MKKILVIVAVLFLSVTVSAQGVKFEEITLQQAMTKAAKNKKEPKLIFLDCYTSWCGPCKTMADEVFTKPICGDYMNANFISIKKDMESDEIGQKMAIDYEIMVYPTFLILDEKGKEVNRIVGAYSAEEFLKYLREAAADSYTDLQKRVDADPKDIETGIRLIKVMSRGYRDASSVVEKIYPNVPNDMKYSKEFYELLFFSIAPTSPLLDDILINMGKVKLALGEDVVKKCVSDFFSNYLMETIRDFGEHKIENIRRAAIALGTVGLSESDPNSYVGEIIYSFHMKNSEAIVSCVENYFHLLPPSEAKFSLEDLMGPGENEAMKERIKNYYKKQVELSTSFSNFYRGRSESLK